MRSKKPKGRLYLAARFSRREELRGYARRLREVGYIVDCAWLSDQASGTNCLDYERLSEEQARCVAIQDCADIREADAVLLFTDGSASPYSRGGHHFEAGYAQGLGKPVVVVGPLENVFHRLSGLEWFYNFEVLADIIGLPPEEEDDAS